MHEAKSTVKEKVITGAKTTGKIFGVLARGFVEGATHYAEAQRKADISKIDLPTTITLGAEQLKQLKDLNVWQLEAMFNGKKVIMDDDLDTYAQLKNFNSWQLGAIFGGGKK